MAPRESPTPRDPDHREKEKTVAETKSTAIAPGARSEDNPKMAACDGCGCRFRRRELVELHEDNHDNLTYFHVTSCAKSARRSTGYCRRRTEPGS
jgi:hypothetical protein